MTAIAIQSIGVFTSVGLNVPQAIGSLRTRVQRFQEIDWKGADGEPLVAAVTPIPLGRLRGLPRLVAMGAAALSECARGREQEEAPLLLCCPEPEEATTDAGALGKALGERAGIAIDARQSRAFCSGHTALAEALVYARDLMAAGRVRACYAGGVDSLLEEERLERLEKQMRLKAGGADGFIPGEGAAFLRLAPRPDGMSLARICGLGLAREEATRGSGRPNAGMELTRAAVLLAELARARPGGGSR